jgi:hypothetical protein
MKRLALMGTVALAVLAGSAFAQTLEPAQSVPPAVEAALAELALPAPVILDDFEDLTAWKADASTASPAMPSRPGP